MVDPQRLDFRHISKKDEASESPVKKDPSHKPKANQDFRKVLAHKEKEEEEKKIKERAKKKSKEEVQTKPSLFELSAQNAQEAKASQDAAKHSKESLPETDFISDDIQHTVFPKRGKFADRTEFSQEQPDLSYVNPLSELPTNASISSALRTSEGRTAPTQLQEIINQIVDKVYILKTEERTDTTLTLKHPPLFEGATLTISAYDTARGEFNVSFHNLTQQAKALLDMQENQNAIRHALEQKGYTMHIVVATTTPIETPSATASEESSHGKREQQGDKEQQQREQEEEE